MATQVVAEVLGVRMDRIRVISADSAVTPKDNGSYSSRVTFMVGNASLHAAEEAQACWSRPRRRLNAFEQDIEVLDEMFIVRGSPNPACRTTTQ
jgi:4-hydroxybenzoyl-CoA reductase subunit alpha